MALSIVRRQQGCSPENTREENWLWPQSQRAYIHTYSSDHGSLKAGALRCTPSAGRTERDSNKHRGTRRHTHIHL